MHIGSLIHITPISIICQLSNSLLSMIRPESLDFYSHTFSYFVGADVNFFQELNDSPSNMRRIKFDCA